MSDPEILVAAGKGDLELVTKLIAQGADVNAKGDHGMTALMEAAALKDPRTAKLLLAHGADTKATNKFGATALNWAATNGNTEIAVAIIEKGGDVNALTRGTSPLMDAAMYGHTETVAALIKHGANINLTNEYGMTALIQASRSGQTETAETLLNNGANINANPEFPALAAAARERYVDTVQMLVARGADLNNPVAKEYGMGVDAAQNIQKILPKIDADKQLRTTFDTNRDGHVQLTEVVTALRGKQIDLIDLPENLTAASLANILANPKQKLTGTADNGRYHVEAYKDTILIEEKDGDRVLFNVKVNGNMVGNSIAMDYSENPELADKIRKAVGAAIGSGHDFKPLDQLLHPESAPSVPTSPGSKVIQK